MTLLGRGTVADCDNPLLDIFISLGPGGPPVNVASLEYQICDNTTGTPVQVFPATPGTREVLDPSQDCPAGARLGTGHFVAHWTVPDAQPLGSHLLKWWFRQTLTSAEESFTEEFQVVELSATGDYGGASVTSFLARFPHFGNQSPALIQIVLDEAARLIGSPGCFGNRYEDAQQYLAAHLLTLNGSSRGSGAQAVAAGSASISFGVLEAGRTGLEKTGYGRTYLDLMRFSCGPGARVIC